ncbi:hypothetical protein VPHF99_0170 [Vibrio phage F99]
MNNFELHEIAQELADTHTPYQLAKLLVKTMEHLDNFDRYNNTNMEYLNSPFGVEVRDHLRENLVKVLGEVSYSDLKEV